MRDSIVKHLEANKVITADQHGFVPGKSCATNLIEFYDNITLAMDQHQSADIVFLDFAKAFDKVPHKALLAKLESCGVRGKVWSWIRAWLSNRRMRVVINGQKSTWLPVLSGVPQGSVLGPILFVIYINDIGEGLTDTFHNMFADDTKIGRVVESAQDGGHLQAALDGADSWSKKWGMPFNVTKCKVMHIGRNNPRLQYKMAGVDLTTTEAERDVGVLVTPAMKWQEQSGKAAATASRVLSQISRAFSYRDKVTFVSLYKSYVRPHLEFSSQAWSPWLARDIDILEKVQKRAVNMVGGLRSVTYAEQLAELGLQSLEERRREADLLLMHKVVYAKSGVNSERWVNARNDARPLTRAAADATRLNQPRANLEVRKNFYTVRAARSWNELPQDLRGPMSVQRFKTALRRHAAAHADGAGRPARGHT